MHAAESSTSRAIIGMAEAIFVGQARSLLAVGGYCHSTALYLGQLNYSPEAIALLYCTKTRLHVPNNYTALQSARRDTHTRQGPESSVARV